MLVSALEGMLDAIPDALVTAGHDTLPETVATEPVCGVRLILWLVDELGPSLGHSLAVGLNSGAKVELVADLKVKLRLSLDLLLSIVLGVQMKRCFYSTHVRSSNVQHSTGSPLTPGFLVLVADASFNFPSVVIDKSAAGLGAHLVAGEGPCRIEVAAIVINLQYALGLL